MPRILNAYSPVNTSHPLNNGLLGWWKTLPSFMGGTTLFDIVKIDDRLNTKRDASFVTVTPDTAWSFDSVNSYAPGSILLSGTSMEHLQILDDGTLFDFTEVGYLNFTLSIWVKFSAFSTSWWEAALIAKDVGGGGNTKWIFSYDTTSENLLFHINDVGNSGPTIQDAGTFAAATNVWYNLGVTRTGNDYRFYVNGKQSGTTQTNSFTILDSAAPVTFGFGEGSTDSLDGKIDDIRIYNKAVSSEGMNLLYQETFNPYTTLLKYHSVIPQAIIPRDTFSRLIKYGNSNVLNLSW